MSAACSVQLEQRVARRLLAEQRVARHLARGARLGQAVGVEQHAPAGRQQVVTEVPSSVGSIPSGG